MSVDAGLQQPFIWRGKARRGAGFSRVAIARRRPGRAALARRDGNETQFTSEKLLDIESLL